eukprot:15478133-Alexandrium_andersonii.AAC.1
MVQGLRQVASGGRLRPEGQPVQGGEASLRGGHVAGEGPRRDEVLARVVCEPPRRVSALHR